MTVTKQLKAIKKLAVKFYDKNPEHFGAVIKEIDTTLEDILLDSLAHIEAMEESETESFGLRDIA